MAQNTATDDPRPNSMKTEMAEHFVEFETEYRDGDFSEVVYEDDQVVVVADHKGYELNEWAEEFDAVERDELSEWFHSAARSLMDDQEAHDIFATAYPIIFDKLE